MSERGTSYGLKPSAKPLQGQRVTAELMDKALKHQFLRLRGWRKRKDVWSKGTMSGSVDQAYEFETLFDKIVADADRMRSNYLK